VDDRQQEAWEQVIRSLGAGFLARWDRHDPETLEEAVGPVPRAVEEEAERELDPVWFG
jgi:hypothetical protein